MPHDTGKLMRKQNKIVKAGIPGFYILKTLDGEETSLLFFPKKQ